MNKKSSIHYWSKEEKEYLGLITPGRSYKEITKLMNSNFEYQFNVEQIARAIKRYKLNTGRTGHFEKGHSPFNKGMKGVIFGGKETQFKKGSIPPNKRNIGSERVNVDGYIEVKIKEPNVWAAKHRVIYEEAHGKIPQDHVVIFADSNKENLDINNLILVSRSQLLVLNRKKLIKDDAELTKTGIVVADLVTKIWDIQKK